MSFRYRDFVSVSLALDAVLICTGIVFLVPLRAKCCYKDKYRQNDLIVLLMDKIRHQLGWLKP